MESGIFQVGGKWFDVCVASAFDGMRVRWDGLDTLDAVARRAGEMFAAREAERRGEAMEEG